MENKKWVRSNEDEVNAFDCEIEKSFTQEGLGKVKNLEDISIQKIITLSKQQ